jgi:hypothetical protein
MMMMMTMMCAGGDTGEVRYHAMMTYAGVTIQLVLTLALVEGD